MVDLFMAMKSVMAMQEKEMKLLTSSQPMVQDETKLSLAVCTPSCDINAKKPVMVWIHGGGWSMGSAEMYDGSILSGFGDVVVVTISYRLGLPGFLFGNWGLFDQLEALKWVKSNITSYGGDPDNVTIFGGSEGACSVEALLCTTLSTGLFHRAIGQSGCLKANTFDKVNRWRHEKVFGVLLNIFGASTQEELHSILTEMPIQQLLERAKVLQQYDLIVDPIFDNDFFIDPIMNGKFVQNVPTILGMNSSEFAAMMGSFTPNLMEGWSEEEFVANLGPMLHVSGEVSKDFLKRAKKNYKMDSNDKMRYSKLFLQTYADDLFLGSLQRCYENCKSQKMFYYNLDVQWQMFHNAPYKGNSTHNRPDFCRSDHGDDVMMVFGIGLGKSNKFIEKKFWSAEEKELSKRMMTAWTDFARTGDPGWPEFKFKKTIHKFGTPSDSDDSAERKDIQKRLKFWKDNYFGSKTTSR